MRRAVIAAALLGLAALYLAIGAVAGLVYLAWQTHYIVQAAALDNGGVDMILALLTGNWTGPR